MPAPDFTLPDPGEMTVIKPNGVMSVAAWLLILFGAGILVKGVIVVFISGQDILPVPVYLIAVAVGSLLPILLADMAGATYTVSLSGITRRGFLGFKNTMAWETVTGLRIEQPFKEFRDVSIRSGRRRFHISSGLKPINRKNFFKAARYLVAIAQSRGISISFKGGWRQRKIRPDDLKYWFDVAHNKFSPPSTK